LWEKACELAKKYDGNESYSGVYRAIKKLAGQ
jgi:hypothetical protein